MSISWLIYFIFLKQLKDLNDQQIIEEAEYEAMKQEALRMAEEKAFKDKLYFWSIVVVFISLIFIAFKIIKTATKKVEEKPLLDKETEENNNFQK